MRHIRTEQVTTDYHFDDPVDQSIEARHGNGTRTITGFKRAEVKEVFKVPGSEPDNFAVFVTLIGTHIRRDGTPNGPERAYWSLGNGARHGTPPMRPRTPDVLAVVAAGSLLWLLDRELCRTAAEIQERSN